MIIIDFTIALLPLILKKYDIIINIIDKFFKRITFILKQETYIIII
jgi:hypothetical protein